MEHREHERVTQRQAIWESERPSINWKSNSWYCLKAIYFTLMRLLLCTINVISRSSIFSLCTHRLQRVSCSSFWVDFCFFFRVAVREKFAQFDSLLFYTPASVCFFVCVSRLQSMLFLCSRLFNINGNGSQSEQVWMHLNMCWQCSESVLCSNDFSMGANVVPLHNQPLLNWCVEMYFIACNSLDFYHNDIHEAKCHEFWLRLSTSCCLNTNWMNGG